MITPAKGSNVWLYLSGLVLIAAILAGGYAAYWVWSNISAHIPLREQQARIEIHHSFPVTVDILDPLQVDIDTVIASSVPINQDLTIPLNEQIDVSIDFNGAVPVKMNVPVNETIHIDQKIAVNGEVSVKILGFWVDVPIKGKLPVKTDIPIRLNIPVDRLIDLSFSAPATVNINDDITVSLKTLITADIPIKANLSVPVLKPLNANVTLTEKTDITITEMDLDVPLKDLRFNNSQFTANKTQNKKEDPKLQQKSQQELRK
ncbi:MAG: hypothetical protein P1U57_02395 [Oleibacter sp.]|nr:hypothetical protein [Thalassolituus sp.]